MNTLRKTSYFTIAVWMHLGATLFVLGLWNLT